MAKWFLYRSQSAIMVLILAISLLAAGCSQNTQTATQASKAEGQVVVKVLDIGQGDAILIRSGGQITLIDSGDTPARDKLVSYIKQEGITVIDKLLLTHPHNDHIGGVAAIFDHFTVKQIYDSGQTTTTVTYRKYLETVEKKKIPFALLSAGSQVDIGGGAILKILAPEKPFFMEDNGKLDLNNNSIVAKLEYGTFAMLLTGDAEKDSENRMLSKYGNQLKSAVLKVGHHGSNTSSSPEFLRIVEPETAIISVGANNDYHHPHPSTLKKYADRKVKLYRTDTNGIVTITSDGKSYHVSKEKG